MVKILISFAWMITISLQPTMGVAWHRFTGFPNIWFKREASGGTALGAAAADHVGGKPVDLEDIEDLDEDASLGVGAVEDFTWKGMLDFTTCTECGRCQSQCPAWNTEKPLSPKLLIMDLRDHAYAKAPYLLAAEGDAERRCHEAADGSELRDRGRRGRWSANRRRSRVTACTARPEASSTPTCCGRAPPAAPASSSARSTSSTSTTSSTCAATRCWSSRTSRPSSTGCSRAWRTRATRGTCRPRRGWTGPRACRSRSRCVGEDVESLDEVEWLFWVGCAGAYEDRAKKTTRAVAELLDMAGVSFAVLGNGETCTGDPARRAGNEFVFQGLAQQNVETFKERVKKVVSTCAHCFNTLKNEYPQFGVELEVVHHTQLLNRLVRERPADPGRRRRRRRRRVEAARSPTTTRATSAGTTRSTRRRASCSRCCPARVRRDGAQLASGPSAAAPAAPGCGWRRRSARGSTTTAPRRPSRTGADQIAVGCPFCRVMLSDGLTARAGQRRGPRGGRGPRRRADAARLGAPRAALGRWRGRRARGGGGDAVRAGSRGHRTRRCRHRGCGWCGGGCCGAGGRGRGRPVGRAGSADCRRGRGRGTRSRRARAGPLGRADSAATAAAVVVAPVAAEPEPDPWDEPAAPTAAAAVVAAPAAAEPEPDPWDEPAAPTAAAAPAAAEPDPWDEPSPTGPDASSGEPVTTEPEPAAVTAPTAVDESVRPLGRARTNHGCLGR